MIDKKITDLAFVLRSEKVIAKVFSDLFRRRSKNFRITFPEKRACYFNFCRIY